MIWLKEIDADEVKESTRGGERSPSPASDAAKPAAPAAAAAPPPVPPPVTSVSGGVDAGSEGGSEGGAPGGSAGGDDGSERLTLIYDQHPSLPKEVSDAILTQKRSTTRDGDLEEDEEAEAAVVVDSSPERAPSCAVRRLM